MNSAPCGSTGNGAPWFSYVIATCSENFQFFLSLVKHILSLLEKTIKLAQINIPAKGQAWKHMSFFFFFFGHNFAQAEQLTVCFEGVCKPTMTSFRAAPFVRHAICVSLQSILNCYTFLPLVLIIFNVNADHFRFFPRRQPCVTFMWPRWLQSTCTGKVSQHQHLSTAMTVV